MVFYIKMEDFKQKIQLMEGGHMPKEPATITYTNVVSRKLVHIELMIATINDLEIKSVDTMNTY